MADQHPTAAMNGIQTTTGTSKHDKTFEFSSSEVEHFDDKKNDAPSARSVPVHWAPGTPWTVTSLVVQELLGISRYEYRDNGSSAPAQTRYTFGFSNTKGSKWIFTDNRGDRFVITVRTIGTHYATFSSNWAPTIVSVALYETAASQGTSKLGRPYEFGTADLEDVKKKIAGEQAESLLPVHWVPTAPGGPWIPTSPEVQALGISEYKLEDYKDQPGMVWRYHLSFINSKGWGFAFTDESNDTYTCSTWNGSHWIRYNSDHPIIVNVSTN